LETSSIGVLVVDDYEPFRHFIRSKLSDQPRLQVVAEAADGLLAVQKAEELQPDLILLDIGLPKLNGIEAARRIRKLSPRSKILFVSQQTSLDLVRAALDTGAKGYVLKADAGSQLLEGVDAVLEGRTFVSRSLANRDFSDFKNSQSHEDVDASRLNHLLTADLNDSDDFQILLEEVLDTAMRATQADFGTIQLFDPATNDLTIRVQRGFGAAFLKFFERVHDGYSCACGTALKGRSRVVVDDVVQSPIFSDNQTRNILLSEEVRSVQSTPLINASNELLGILSTHYRVPRPFSEYSLQQLDVMASRAVHLIERWRELQSTLS